MKTRDQAIVAAISNQDKLLTQAGAGRYVVSLPGLLQRHGLLQTLAFLQRKAAASTGDEASGNRALLSLPLQPAARHLPALAGDVPQRRDLDQAPARGAGGRRCGLETSGRRERCLVTPDTAYRTAAQIEPWAKARKVWEQAQRPQGSRGWPEHVGAWLDRMLDEPIAAAPSADLRRRRRSRHPTPCRRAGGEHPRPPARRHRAHRD